MIYHRDQNNGSSYSGEAILDFYEFKNGLQMPSAIVNCINGYASTVIQNALDQPKRLTITTPFAVINYVKHVTEIRKLTAKKKTTYQQIIQNWLKTF